MDYTKLSNYYRSFSASNDYLNSALRDPKPRRNNIIVELHSKSLKLLEDVFSPGGNVPLLPGVQLQVVQLEGLELCVDSPLAVLGGPVAPVQHTALAPDQLEPVVPQTYLIITMS